MAENINKLMKLCIDYFQAHGFTEKRISRYQTLWRYHVLPFMLEKGTDILTDELVNEYRIRFHHNGNVRYDDHEAIRSITVLADIMHTGVVSYKKRPLKQYPLDGPIGESMMKFLSLQINQRKGESTVYRHRYNLYLFLGYLRHNGVSLINEIKENHIIRFISSIDANRELYACTLRQLLLYWKSEKLISEDLFLLLKNYRRVRREKIPSFYTSDEVRIIESSIERNTLIGKRSYAMLLLASRLGLRASDIAYLEFSNIDWQNNEIRLYQKKTGNPIVLPLLADVGNAIIDYLQYARPKSNSNRIFLSARAPYHPTPCSIVSCSINNIISSSGILTKRRRHGPHALRFSLASGMLSTGATLPTISEVLGHSSPKTSMQYLKIDLHSLRQCVLEVPVVPDSFYMQKGGVFYE